jgi:F0F1-type ATP synthase assembly protein I
VASLDAAYKMVGPVIMGLMIGYFMDQHFKTSPWWLLGMTLFGLITGFWSLLRPLYLPSPPENPEPGQNPSAPDSDKPD